MGYNIPSQAAMLPHRIAIYSLQTQQQLHSLVSDRRILVFWKEVTEH